jgi:peptide-methionine (S)-S-oxide reductase
MRAAALLIPMFLMGAVSGPFPDPTADVKPTAGSQTAVFAGGCFWCTEAVFEQLKGVKNVVSGYAGGSKATAHYQIVSAGMTDHAESIEVTFDPKKITYGQLLKVFFSVAHDPTTLNYQGPDHGKQYRSAVFYTSDEQKKVAAAYIEQLNKSKVFASPIVTQVVPLEKFYAAEDYHQDFVRRNPEHPYVVANAIPKLKKLKKAFPDLAR